MYVGATVRDVAGMKGVILSIDYVSRKAQVRWSGGEHTTWIKLSFLEDGKS